MNFCIRPVFLILYELSVSCNFPYVFFCIEFISNIYHKHIISVLLSISIASVSDGTYA